MKPQTRLVSIRLALSSLLGAVVAAPALADTESATFNGAWRWWQPVRLMHSI